MTNDRHTLAACLAAAIGCAAFSCGGCSQPDRSNVTLGAAKRHIQPGVTTQAEVIEIFGSPNIATRKEGGEMWVYDKISSHQTANAFGIGVAGGDGGVGGLGSGGRRTSSRSETTVMLIVYFDTNDVVADYKISQTKF